MALCVQIAPDGYVYQAPQQEPCEAFRLVTADEFGELSGMGSLWSPDWEFTGWVLGSCLLMFAVGAWIGIVLNQVRKMRR